MAGHIDTHPVNYTYVDLQSAQSVCAGLMGELNYARCSELELILRLVV